MEFTSLKHIKVDTRSGIEGAGRWPYFEGASFSCPPGPLAPTAQRVHGRDQRYGTVSKDLLGVDLHHPQISVTCYGA